MGKTMSIDDVIRGLHVYLAEKEDEFAMYGSLTKVKLDLTLHFSGGKKAEITARYGEPEGEKSQTEEPTSRKKLIPWACLVLICGALLLALIFGGR